MATIVNGTDIVLTKNDPVYGVIPMACSRTCQLSISLSTQNVTNYNSNNYNEYKADLIGWGITSDGFIILSNYSYALIVDDILNRSLVFMQFSINNGADGYFVYSGYCYIESISLSGPYNDAGTYNVSFKGTGQLTKSGVNPLPTISAVQDTDYTATGGETFIILPILIGKTVLNLFRGGVRCGQILTSGSPTGADIKFTTATGRIDFDPTNPLVDTEYISINYK